MNNRTHTFSGVAMVATLACCLAIGACRKQGPAERAGEKIDDAVDKMEDAIDPKGPAEKAGDAIDDAIDDMKD